MKGTNEERSDGFIEKCSHIKNNFGRTYGRNTARHVHLMAYVCERWGVYEIRIQTSMTRLNLERQTF